MDDFNSQDTFHSFSSPLNPHPQSSSQPQSQDHPQQQHPVQSQPSQYTLDNILDDDDDWAVDDLFNNNFEYDPLHENLTSEQPLPLSASMPATTRSSHRAAQQQRPSRPGQAGPPSHAPATDDAEAGGERAPKRRRLNGSGSAAGSAPFAAASADNTFSDFSRFDDDFSGFDEDLAELPESRFANQAARDGHQARQYPPMNQPMNQEPTLTPNHGRFASSGFAEFIPLDDDSSPAHPGHTSYGNANLPSSPLHRHGGSRSARAAGFQTVDPSVQLQQLQRLQEGHGGGGGGGSGGGGGEADAIDLTGVTDAASLRQRELIDEQERRARREASMKMEARKAANQRMLKSTLAEEQRVEEKKAAPAHKGIGDMQCVICMDDFTDLTATHCGHLFCHTCINEHLITAEMGVGNRSALCPFCRQPVYRVPPTRSRDKDKTIVPLIFKVKQRAPVAEKTGDGAGAGKQEAKDPKVEQGVQAEQRAREVERPD